jgi:hypothetical protein
MEDGLPMDDSLQDAGLPGHGLVLPENPRSGKVVASHHVFSGCGLFFHAYVRNKFRPGGDVPEGEKKCLKIVALVKKGARSYGSPADKDESISLEVEGRSLLALHAVLSGTLPEYTLRIPRAGHEVKALSVQYKEVPGKDNPDARFYLALSQGNRNYGTRFDVATSWGFQMVIAAVLKMQFPTLGADLLFNSHLRMGEMLREP